MKVDTKIPDQKKMFIQSFNDVELNNEILNSKIVNMFSAKIFCSF